MVTLISFVCRFFRFIQCSFTTFNITTRYICQFYSKYYLYVLLYLYIDNISWNHRRKPMADYALFLTASPWVDSYKFPRFHEYSSDIIIQSDQRLRKWNSSKLEVNMDKSPFHQVNCQLFLCETLNSFTPNVFTQQGGNFFQYLH